ncbi:hypothetical protein [Epilithonimonas sp.]|uniref:hypothetical protein n=1 Tax=Epilithonimonas sp. TaxID=2894511 RepID=UPI00289DEFD8|nr:hypothetical protein [Epilithonimonas sp.]
MEIDFTKILLGTAIAILSVSCTPDRVEGDGNGLTPTNSDASFTVTKTSENHYRLSASNNNYIQSRWDLGDGGGLGVGPNVYDVFIPDEGTYTVQHQIIGQGGIVGGTASQTITVDKSDPAAGNMIQGGKFADATDVAKWSLTFPNPSNTALWIWDFTNGKATFTAKNWDRNVMYQEVNVVEGRKYTADAVVSSKGVADSWFEIYVGYAKPTANNDYTGDGNDSTWLRAINTWAGSGTSAFEGKISNVGSKNANNPDGTFTATKSGVAYFAIRSGGNDMKDGISITKVEFRGVN